MRVLQVEDDVSASRVVEKMLRAEGHRCETTPLGEEALEMLSHNDYDVVLLDIMLPDIDGYEVIRRLRDVNIDTPVVIQSGLIGRSEMEKGSSFGIEDYLVKPFSKAELTGCIDRALKRHASTADTDGHERHDEYDRRTAPRPDDSTRREHPRVRTLKSAQIIYNNWNCITDCVILNVSDGGAAIQLRDFIDIPENFLLKTQYGSTRTCEVCWRHGKKLGIRFLPESA